MVQAFPRASSASVGQAPGARGRRAARPFLGIIDCVLLSDPGEHVFEGAIGLAEADAIWTWMVRDVAPDLIDPEVTERDPAAREALVALLPELLERTRKTLASAATSRDIEARIRRQLASEGAWERLTTTLTALKCREALEKAQSFGRAANGIQDDAAMAMALQSMPLRDPAIGALLMQAAVGSMAAPLRFVTAAVRIAGAATEAAMRQAGFAPLMEALLAHAQNQIPLLSEPGVFADADLACRAVNRFHRLSRAVDFIALERGGRWAQLLAQLTGAISTRLEPRLRGVALDTNRALRRGREGHERFDSDDVLIALNGCYLLATARDCRDSLALNAVIDQVWGHLGEVLEIQLERSLEALRQSPGEAAIRNRLDAGIKMAELRFGKEYGEIMRRARDTAERGS